jgi:hypothetical protein
LCLVVLSGRSVFGVARVPVSVVGLAFARVIGLAAALAFALVARRGLCVLRGWLVRLGSRRSRGLWPLAVVRPPPEAVAGGFVGSRVRSPRRPLSVQSSILKIYPLPWGFAFLVGFNVAVKYDR